MFLIVFLFGFIFEYQAYKMITVISGTNRKESGCLVFAKKYHELLSQLTNEEVRFLALSEIGNDWLHENMYEKKFQSKSISELQDKFIIPATKFVFVSPEYNGSFPGILKLFIDGCSVRAYDHSFKNKKAALIGVATGRAGNLRGMDHLADVLNHVGTIVMPKRLPFSRIQDLTNEDTSEIVNLPAITVMENHAKEFVDF